MTLTWYRLQDADRDATELLDPKHQWSQNWTGSGDPKAGVSVCHSIDSLTGYFARRALDVGYDAEFLSSLVLVTLEGEESDEADDDAAEGVYLCFPTSIVSVEPLPADMIAAICVED